MYRKISRSFMAFILAFMLLVSNGISTISSVDKTVLFQFNISETSETNFVIELGDQKFNLTQEGEYYNLELDYTAWLDIVDENHESFIVSSETESFDFDFALLTSDSEVIELEIPAFNTEISLKENSKTLYILTNPNGGWGAANADLRIRYRNDPSTTTMLVNTNIKYQSPHDKIWYSIYKTDALVNDDFVLERLNPANHDQMYGSQININKANLVNSVLMNNIFESQWAADGVIPNEIKNRFSQAGSYTFSVDASLASLAYPDIASFPKLENLVLELTKGWRVNLISDHKGMFELPDNFNLSDLDQFFINDLRMTHARTGVYSVADFDDLSDPVLHLSASTPHHSVHDFMYINSKWRERSNSFEAPNTKELPEKKIVVEDDVRYVKSSFYDYLSDFELNGNHRKKKTRTSNHDLYVQFRNFNTAMSDYYSSQNADHPIYTGHFQHDSYNSFGFGLVGGSLNLHGYDNYGKFFATNNSMFNLNGPQGDAHGVVPNLVSHSLFENELMISSNNGESSIPSPFFNQEFLLGSNSKNTVLADVYETVAFPFFLEPRDGVPYWTFDSLKHNAQMTRDESNDLYFIDHNVKGVKNKDSAGVELSQYGFFPLNDPSSRGSSQDIYNYNYGTGMRMDIPFSMTSDGKVSDKDIVFEFSGDDDVWIFIDGELALDLGGAHARVEGVLNFTNKEYTLGKDTFFKNSGTTDELPSKKAKFDFDESLSQHVLTIFYMERGQWESNLKMSFNFPENNNLTIKKEVNVEGVHEDFKDFFLDDEFDLSVESHATHYQIQEEEITNKGFKILQSEIRDYGSVAANGLTNALGARYSSKIGKELESDLLVKTDPIKIKNEEILTFENQFRLGSYLKITEDYDKERYQKPLWKVYENGVMVNSDSDLGSSPSDGRIEPSGFGPPIDNKYDENNYDLDAHKTLRFGTYVREEDRNSNLIMDVLVVNRPLVQSLEITKEFLGELTVPVEFIVTITYEDVTFEYPLALNESNQFKGIIDGLPVGAVYTIAEVDLDGYYVHSVTHNGEKTTVSGVDGVISDKTETIHYVNAPSLDIVVEKTWEGVQGEMTGSIKIGLFRNDEEEALKTVDLMSPTWKYVFEDLPKFDEESNLIDYAVFELDSDGNKYLSGANVEINEQRYEVTYPEGEDGKLLINNKYIPGTDFKFKKVRSGTDEVVNLYGAEFKLYRYKYDPDASGLSYFDEYYHNRDKDVGRETEDLKNQDGGNSFILSNLYPDEIYFLEETVVPTGMQMPSGVWMLRINDQGGLDIEAEFNDMPAFGTDADGLLLYNKAQWILSPTGGNVSVYLMVGLLMMASSGVMYLNNKRRNKMKKTKNYLVKLMAFMLVFVSLFNPISAEDTQTIVIKEVSENDEFNVYKVVDIKFNEKSNTVDYYWLYNNKGEVLTEPELIDALLTADQIKAKVISMYPLIKDTTPIDIVTEDGGLLKYTGELGGYLFISETTMDVYNPMVGFIQYVKNDTTSEYDVVADTIVAKKNVITIDKELIEDDIVGKDQIINFKISFPVPKYDEAAIDKKLQVSDYMDSGMLFDSESIEVRGGNDLLVLGTHFNETTIAGKAPIFAYEFVYDTVSKYESITITYSAKVTGDISNTGNNKNSVELVYSNYPHIEDSHKDIKDEVKLGTAGLRVVKVDESELPLAGAEFELYRKVDDLEFADKEVKDGYIFIASGGPSGVDGFVDFEKLAYGEYRLVETKAPFGYQKLRDPIDFEIKEDNTNVDLIHEFSVKNIKGFNLPSTGAAGTYVFTIVGLGIMISGVFLFFKDRTRKNS